VGPFLSSGQVVLLIEEMNMGEKENRSETKEEKGGKALSASLTGLTPFKSLEDRFEQMERFMDRMMGGIFPSRWTRSFDREWPAWSASTESRAPAVDLIDRENEIVVRVELPGIQKEDVSISLTADSITIEAQSRKEAAEEKGDYRRREISASAFSRTIWLPSGVDAEAAKAAFQDGILEVTLPKTAAAKRTTVKID
jgi:HSP20 family protein